MRGYRPATQVTHQTGDTGNNASPGEPAVTCRLSENVVKPPRSLTGRIGHHLPTSRRTWPRHLRKRNQVADGIETGLDSQTRRPRRKRRHPDLVPALFVSHIGRQISVMAVAEPREDRVRGA